MSATLLHCVRSVHRQIGRDVTLAAKLFRFRVSATYCNAVLAVLGCLPASTRPIYGGPENVAYA